MADLRTMAKGVRVAALLAVVAACAAPTASAARPHAVRSPRVALTELESGVLQQLNRVRARHGLVPLRVSAPLTASADEHTREMAADGYFAHPSADGTSFWKRIRKWYGSTDDDYWAVGENLLWSSPSVAAPEALKLWMASPEHRANILDPSWREIGIAALHVADAPGAYHGLAVTIVTTDFGVRR